MTKSILHRLVTLFVVLIATCSQTHAEESKNEFSAAEVGWKTVFPVDGWKRMSAKEKSALTEKGNELIKKSEGEGVDASKLTELLNLKKDPLNSFLSTAEPFDEKANGSYVENQQVVKKTILDAYKTGGVKMGNIRDGKEMVDGLEFITLELEVMHPKTRGEVLMTQKIYSRLINGFDFAMTLSTSNAKDRRALENIVAKSKFFIRK